MRRQQTLRASVDWSHALLTEPERVLFRRLAVFFGGFDLDAAQAVAGTTEVQALSSARPTDAIGGQVSCRSGKHQRPNAIPAPGNSPGVRVLEKLGESGEADDVRVRHREHFMVVCRRAQLSRPPRIIEKSIWNGLTSKSTIFARRSVGAWKTAKQRRRCGSHRRYFLCGRTEAETGEGLAWLEAALGSETANPPSIPRCVHARLQTRSFWLRGLLA